MSHLCSCSSFLFIAFKEECEGEGCRKGKLFKLFPSGVGAKGGYRYRVGENAKIIGICVLSFVFGAFSETIPFLGFVCGNCGSVVCGHVM